MDEARAVMRRLQRIERLREGGGPRDALVAEVRLLLAEGEAWVAAEGIGTGPARRALEECRGRIAPPSDAPPAAA